MYVSIFNLFKFHGITFGYRKIRQHSWIWHLRGFIWNVTVVNVKGLLYFVCFFILWVWSKSLFKNSLSTEIFYSKIIENHHTYYNLVCNFLLFLVKYVIRWMFIKQLHSFFIYKCIYVKFICHPDILYIIFNLKSVLAFAFSEFVLVA